MTAARSRRLAYITFLVLALAMWLAVGDFASVEAPYVRF